MPVNPEVYSNRGGSYYPFGLTMGGISDQVMLKPENRFKYNGIELNHKEFSDGNGLELYTTQFRGLDPQIGRWWQVDPDIENGMQAWSPYASNYDNPITFFDPLGNDPDDPGKGFWSSAWGGFIAGVNWVNENVNPLVPIAETITGKAYDNGNFDVSRSRLQSASEAAVAIVPVGEVVGTVAKVGEKAVANVAEKEIATVTKNAAKGAAFEKTVVKDLEQKGNKNIAEQVTIKADNGVKTRVDVVSRDANGNVKLTEAKASSSAQLSRNQKIAHPSIGESGGTVVGRGKPGFEGGTRIPPTKVDVVRPQN